MLVNEEVEKRNKKYLNTIQEILIEGKSQRNENRLTGRTRGNRIVNFDGHNDLIGKLVNVKITEIKPWALFGEIVNGKR